MRVYKIEVEPEHITDHIYFVLAENFTKATEQANTLVSKLNKLYPNEQFEVENINEWCEVWDGKV